MLPLPLPLPLPPGRLLRCVNCCYCCSEATCTTPLKFKSRDSPKPGEIFCNNCLNNQCPKVQQHVEGVQNQ